MPSSKKKVKNKKIKGIGVDFRKVKHKVGRKLLPASNVTKIEVKSKSIILPGQSVAQEKDGLAVSNRKQTLKELLMQTTHHNDNIRRDALFGIKDLLARHPNELRLHAVTLMEKLCQRITDKDRGVRVALLGLFRTSIFMSLPEELMRPVVPVFMAHICSAMTHLVVNIRVSAFGFLDVFLQNYPSLVAGYVGQIAQFYVESLCKLGVGHVESQLHDVLNSLLQFLSAVHRKSMVSDMIVATRKEDNKMMALHWYKSVLPHGHTSLSENLVTLEEKVIGEDRLSLKMANSLVQALLSRWSECAPLVCSGHAPDATNAECMIKICKALQLTLLCLNPQLKLIHDVDDDGYLKEQLDSLVDGVCKVEHDKWISEVAMPSYSSHLLACFPLCAPPINLPRKVEELLIALNMAIVEVMLLGVIAGSVNIDNKNHCLTMVLDFIEAVLLGKLEPVLGISPNKADKKTMEAYMKSFVRMLPHFIRIIIKEYRLKLLQAFTQIFQRCPSASKLKHTCLTSIMQMLDHPHHMETFFLKDGTLDLQKQWLQSLPRLLWELKHTYPMSSLAVLRVMHHVGRKSPPGSPLAEEYTTLQPILIPFFSTSSSTEVQKGRTFGPFVKLPVECQELAIDLLYYLGRLSGTFLKAIVHCICNSELQINVVLRCIEVLHATFCKGLIELADHVSFLLTLILGPASSEATAACKDRRELNSRRLSGFQRQRLLASKVCLCLSQIGDGRLLMHLLSPIICQHMALPSSPIASYGFLTVVSMLRRSIKDTRDLKMLPAFIAAYLCSICTESSNSKDDPIVKSMIKPCLLLLASSDKLTELVILHLFKLFNSKGEPVYRTTMALLQILGRRHFYGKILHGSDSLSVLKELQERHPGADDVPILMERLSSIVSSAYGWPEKTIETV